MIKFSRPSILLRLPFFYATRIHISYPLFRGLLVTSYSSFICVIVALQVAEEGVSPSTYVIVDNEAYVSTSTMSFCFGKSSNVTICLRLFLID
jgi:hypothetical protein